MSIKFDLNESIELSDYDIDLDKLVCSFEKTKDQIEASICKTYSVYGYCTNLINKKCTKTHDIETIIKLELFKKEKLKRRKLKAKQQSLETEEEFIEENENLNKIRHNAGLDAFMTGYVMLNFLNKFTKFKLKNDVISPNNKNSLNEFDGLDNFNFNVYLTGKDYPLIIQKSNFSSLSLNHEEKKLRLSKN